MIPVRVDPEFKQRTETVFCRLGLWATQAITRFCTQVFLQQGLPFACEYPERQDT